MGNANWMSPRRVLAAGAIVALLAGAGAAYAATSGGGGTSTGAAQTAAREDGRHGAFVKALATELGLEENTVRAALEAVRETRSGPAQFVAALAAQLGVESAALEAALQQVALDHVDELLQAGRITEEQAAERRASIEAGRMLAPRPGRHHRHGPPLEAAASYIGITVAEVRQALQDGQSLAQIATANGKTVDGLVDALVADATARIEKAVEDGKLTESEAQERIAGLEERISELAQRTGPLGSGGPGRQPPGPARGES